MEESPIVSFNIEGLVLMGGKNISSPLIPPSPERERILEIALLKVYLVDELYIRRMSVRAIDYIFHQQLLHTIRQEVSSL